MIVPLFIASAIVFVLPTAFPPARLPGRCVAPVANANFDVNNAVTRLNAAVDREDYAAAKAIKEEIDAARKASAFKDGGGEAAALTWECAPSWLRSRLEDLGFRYPTPVQAASLLWNADAVKSDAESSSVGKNEGMSAEEPASLAEPLMEPMQPALEVIVPAGLVAGDILAVETEDGTQFNVMVPEGCGPGDALLIDLPSNGNGAPPHPPAIQRDAVISAPTGSGKTLAFAVPLLCELSDELERRSLEAVSAVSVLLESPAGSDISPTDTMEALSPSLQTPAGRGDGRKAALTLPPRGSPLGLVITPTGSLAEQAARQIFGLVGGYARESRTYKPGAKDSIVRYGGPKAVRVAVLTSAEDGRAAAAAAAENGGVLRDSEVLIVSAEALETIRDALDTSALRMACVDEADACECAVLGALPASVRRVLIGATVSEAVAKAVEAGWIERPILLSGSGAARAWTLDDLAQALCPPGLTHRFSIAPMSDGENAVQLQLLALARLLRKDLRDWEALGAAAVAMPMPAFATSQGLGSDVPSAAIDVSEVLTRPRAVVFTKDASEALKAGAALRDALWGEQAVVTRAGASPESGAAAFKSVRSNRDKMDFESVISSGGASVLVVPMSEGRGLDFPNVTHVYCLSLGLRPEQANEYAHMAGRAGRVGQAGRGVVTSVINADPDWVSVLSNLNTIVQGSLGRSLEAVAVPSTSEDTDTRRALDDLILLTKDDVANESK